MNIRIKSGGTELTHQSGVLLNLAEIKKLCVYVVYMEQKRTGRKK